MLFEDLFQHLAVQLVFSPAFDLIIITPEFARAHIANTAVRNEIELVVGHVDRETGPDYEEGEDKGAQYSLEFASVG